MFNEQQKRSYLETLKSTATRKDIEQYFYRIKKYETPIGKDIAELNRDELRTVLTQTEIRSENSRQHMLSLLRGYVSWLRARGLGGLNSPIFDINSSFFGSTSSITKQMIRDPEQLMRIVETSVDKNSLENRFIQEALFFKLLYMGIPIEDLPKLKKKDLHASKKTISAVSGEYEIFDDEVIAMWKTFVNVDKLERVNGKSTAKEDFGLSDLIESDYLFRPRMPKSKTKVKEQFPVTTIKSHLNGHFQNYSKDLLVSPTKINQSGLFYKMFSEGGPVTKERIAREFKLGDINDKNVAIKAERLLNEYYDWKIAFNH